MGKQIKTKFVCNNVLADSYGSKQVMAKQAKLSAVYAGDKNAEDNQFAAATPSGEITINVTNPDTMDFLSPGKKYYIYFEECEDQS